MTRKEKEKILLDGLDLRVGDTIKIKVFSSNIICKIEEGDDEYFFKGNENEYYTVNYLLFCDYEKIEPKKKYGDIKCMDITCIYCPLRIVECTANHDNTLYEILDYSFNKHNTSKDSNVYRAIKEELDKEVDNE